MSVKKNILIVCNSQFAYEKFIFETEKFYKKNNYFVDVIIGSDLKKKNINNKYFIKFPYYKIMSYIYFFLTPFLILKVLNKKNYDIIVHNNRNASICSRLALFFYKKKIVSVYFARGMYFHDDQNFLLKALSFLIEVFLLIKTNIVLSQTKEDLIKMNFFLKLLKVKYFYIGNGIDTYKFQPNKRICKKNIFSTTCRVTKGKGLEILLSSFNKLLLTNKDIKLVIIGGPITEADEMYLRKLKNKFNHLFDLKKIKITGLTKKVNYFLNKSKFYVHPSFREGLPRSLLEAMSSGNIPIASRIRGSREVIKNKINGYLYNAYSKEDLYKIMLKVTKMSNFKLHKMRHRSIITIKKNYNLTKYLSNQLKYL
jgi:glycosyltransferase involved in cell wall biosynthesis